MEKGINVVCVDEKTGMQALERIHPDLPSRPGKTRCVEHEYTRHGTKCLIANLLAATGESIAPSIGDIRTELDFMSHIQQTVATDPEKQWVFIADQLNTHKGELLVRWVAKQIGFEDDLGIKGRSGILKNMDTRRDFLEDTSHRIRFAFTPKHCSWLNWVEVWFSKLAKRVLIRGSFESAEILVDKILKFIAYHNKFEAKPYKWTACPEKAIQDLKTILG
jgi:transposase